MARKPIPGADSGMWGTILNDFLDVAHDNSGNIKSNAIGATALQDGAVTNSKIAAGIDQSKITSLTTDLAAKADRSTTVTLADNQTITGAKTFTVAPIVPAPSADNHAANKAYVDARAVSVDRAVYPVVSHSDGSWPSFASVYPTATLPLAMTNEVRWYVAAAQSSATIPTEFEKLVGTASRTIGGVHTLWGYPLTGSATVLDPNPNTTPSPDPDPNPDTGVYHILASGQTFPLSGTDVARVPGTIARYTDALTQTPTNMWGVEVVIRNGTVIEVHDRNVTGAGPTQIPTGCYVLSGNGTAARAWLNMYAPLGATVAIRNGEVPVPTVTVPIPTETTTASSVTIGTQSYDVAGVDIVRPSGAMVAYSSLYKHVPTNRWGLDVVVSASNVVLEHHDRAINDGPAPAIPAGGYVLSGHLASRQWLIANAPIGSTITLAGDVANAVQVSPGALAMAATAGTGALPDRVTATYVNLRVGPASAEIPKYNVIYAGFATATNGQQMALGTLGFDTPETLKATISADHARGARWILSIGGGVELARQTFIRTEAEADTVYTTLLPIIDEYGFKGIDYNLENGPDGFTAAALLYLSQKLKTHYGAQFAITMTPRPFENFFLAIAAQHHAEGLLDALQLQFYDVIEARIDSFLQAWINERLEAAVAAGVPYGHIIVGAIADPDYERGGNTGAAYEAIINKAVKEHGLRGGFVWDAARERDNGLPFLRALTKSS